MTEEQRAKILAQTAAAWGALEGIIPEGLDEDLTQELQDELSGIFERIEDFDNFVANIEEAA